MKGRTEENIKKSMEKMHKIAEIVFDQELEVIPTWIDKEPGEECVNSGVWYLGKSIQLLSEADFFVGVEWTDFYKGCSIERTVARDYGIRSTFVDTHFLMPDAVDVEREFWASMEKTCNPAPM